MATFAIDLLTGKEYLFNGNYTNSGMTTFTGVTSVGNGLSMVGSQQAKLGGTLTQSTTFIGSDANHLKYSGDYSSGFTARSIIDKGYVDLAITTVTTSALQLIDISGGTDVNTISATTINWTTQVFSGTSLSFTGGSRIHIQANGVYGISYVLNVDNTTGNIKNIGTVIRKNGNTDITTLSSSSFGLDTTNNSSINSMPRYLVTLVNGDYLELLGFRVGSDGAVNTRANGSWINIKKE